MVRIVGYTTGAAEATIFGFDCCLYYEDLMLMLTCDYRKRLRKGVDGRFCCMRTRVSRVSFQGTVLVKCQVIRQAIIAWLEIDPQTFLYALYCSRRHDSECMQRKVGDG